MDADVERKRTAIKDSYSSATWKNKVDKMSPAQVIAIYLKFVREGRLR